jgi:guanylate kinase
MVKQGLGNLFIVAAPSGGGKTSLVKHLVEYLSDIVVSVSHTTRDQRPGEEEGVHYFFTNEVQFAELVQSDQFIEHARVFDRSYGTSRAQIKERLNQGMDVVLDIDWQGAAQIKRHFPEAVSVFILPPSLDVLGQRLRDRQRDNEAVIHERMRRAKEELSHYVEFDYLIVNDDFEKAAVELMAIVTARRLRFAQQVVRQEKLLSFLLSSQ